MFDIVKTVLKNVNSFPSHKAHRVTLISWGGGEGRGPPLNTPMGEGRLL